MSASRLVAAAHAVACACACAFAIGCGPAPDTDAAPGSDSGGDAGPPPTCLLDKDCNDLNVCTDDTCDPATRTCSSVVDDTNEVPQGGPGDCVHEICQGGQIVVLNDASEVPMPVSPIDCRLETCVAGAVVSVDDDDETPLPDDDPCTADGCVDGAGVYPVVPDGTGCDTDDNSVTEEVCVGGVCVASQCGDGVADPALGEDCDPGAPVAGDRCSSLCVIPPALFGTIDLGTAAPPARVVGAVAGDALGGAALAVGDVDGDGVGDLLAGAPGAATLHVVLGTAAAVGGWPVSRDLGSSPGDVVLSGPPGFPSAVATADVSGDGIADIVVGAAGADGGAGAGSGAVWVVFGRDFTATGAQTTFDLGAGDADLTFTPLAAGDALGAAVAAGDVTGDGAPDLVLGAPGGDGPGGLFPDGGEVYVFDSSAFVPGGTTSVLLADLLFHGDAGDALGMAVATGNIGGSAVGDVIAGGPGHDGQAGTLADAGAVGVVFGTAFSLATVAISAADVLVEGGDAGDALGAAVTAGDFNGDGAPDLFYGAPEGDTFMNAAADDGDAYTAWGPLAAGVYVATAIVLPEFFGGGAELYGEGEDFGAAIATGDINDDGYADLIVTDPLACSVTPCDAEAGEMYLTLGRPFSTIPGLGGATRFQVATGSFVLTVRGAAPLDHLGTTIAAGDLDADGLADMVIGIPDADGTGGTRPDGGEIAIVFGGGNLTPP
jgi:cysteine-rich repeat protein